MRTHVLTEETIFECNTNNEKSDGGSFLFMSEGQCVQNRICCFQSCLPATKLSYKGVYCCTIVSSSADAKNFIVDSSIIESGKTSTGGFANVYLMNGKQIIKTLNISSADVLGRSLHELNNISSNSVVSFCFFANNSCSDSQYYACSHTKDIEKVVSYRFCNFQENKKCGGLILSYGPSLSFKDCSILQNEVLTFAYSTQFPIYILIDHCFFDRIDGLNDIQTIIFTIEATTKFILSQLSTAQCLAEIPKIFVDEEDIKSFYQLNNYAMIYTLLLTNRIDFQVTIAAI